MALNYEPSRTRCIVLYFGSCCARVVKALALYLATQCIILQPAIYNQPVVDAAIVICCRQSFPLVSLLSVVTIKFRKGLCPLLALLSILTLWAKSFSSGFSDMGLVSFPKTDRSKKKEYSYAAPKQGYVCSTQGAKANSPGILLYRHKCKKKQPTAQLPYLYHIGICKKKTTRRHIISALWAAVKTHKTAY